MRPVPFVRASFCESLLVNLSKAVLLHISFHILYITLVCLDIYQY